MRRTWIRALAIAACLGTAAAHDGVPTGWVPAPYLDVPSERGGA